MNNPEVGTTIGITLSLILFFVLLLIAIATAVAGAVFLGLCVYNDARSRRNPNAVIWGVLSGFFEIAALIYLIITMSSKNQPPRCERCGSFLYPGYPGYSGAPVCPVCGQPVTFLPPEQAQLYARRRKRYLILWIVSMAACVVMIFVAVILFTLSMLSNASFLHY